MVMKKLEVGKPYDERLRNYPERIQFDFSDAGGVLLIAYKNPTSEEIEAIRKGKINLGLVKVNGIIFVLAKFGDLDWMDAPYNVFLSKPFTLQELPDESTGYSINIVFINSVDTVVKALRLVGMPHEMSMQFKEYVEYQKSLEVEQLEPSWFDSCIKYVYENYTTKQLLKLPGAKIYNLKV